MRVRNRVILAVLGVLVIISIPVSGVAADKLSFTPPAPCKKPPKSPPIKLLNQFFPDIEGDTKPDAYGVGNQPFETNVDINGDGWCDWVSFGATAPHMFGESPPMEHFLFLGTKTGWRHFGKMKIPNLLDQAPLIREDGPTFLSPESEVLSFQDPLFVYFPPQNKPYVIVTRTMEDRITPQIHNVDIYVWNDNVDMLELLTPKGRVPIIFFIRDGACKNPVLIQLQNNWNQTLDAICRGTSSILKIPGETLHK